MNRREFLAGVSSAATGLMLSSVVRANDIFFSDLQEDSQGNKFAEGFVFSDRNGTGKKEGNPGVANVCVSNGREVTRTDSKGQWRLPVTTDCVIFVIKPTGWMNETDADGLPTSYYVHRPKGSPSEFKYAGSKPTGEIPRSIDFALKRQKEDSRFRMVLFGDPQPRNQREIDYMAHDLIEEVIIDARNVDAKFGLSLGDEMFNDLSLYGSLNRTIGRIGLPWYNTVGNHDLNFDAQNHETSTESYVTAYGPTYFAFEYANVHFMVLNNVLWHGAAANGKPGGFHGEISAVQLEFIKNYLKFVPKDRLLVLAMHIPLHEMRDPSHLYRLIEDREHTFSMSAHTHVQGHYFVGEAQGWKGKKPHHHLNHATVCGSWWGGNPDERGIPHATMTDGTPNGYSIVEFDKTNYKVTFRAASRPFGDQMSIWLPEMLPSAQTDSELLVNVFAGSEKSLVEYRVGSGEWNKMTQITREDPNYMRLKELEVGVVPPKGYYKLQPATKCRHIWTAKLPIGLSVGTHAVEIRTVDMFRQEYHASRIVRIV
jgi:hypothetical protein